MPDGPSQAEELARLPEDERRAFLAGLSDGEKLRLLTTWSFWRRPKQGLPPGDWFVWLLLCGRGFGKTRTAAEATRYVVETNQAGRIALIAPTAADTRDVMVEGESGLLNVFPRARRPLYEPSKRRVTFHNGAIATLYSAEEPERLRGPQHDFAWLDEPAAWRDLDKAWLLLVPGLRLGDKPRAILTTTPRPLPLFNRLLEDERTVFTNGSTWENGANLPEQTLTLLRSTYEGTDLGLQELEGQLLGQNPGALWRKDWLDTHRVAVAPELRRIIVAIDPSSSAKEEACEVGIVVCGLGVDGKGYVLADYSTRTTPAEWVRIAIKARADHRAEKIVYEGNMGAGFIVDIFRLVDRDSLRFLKGVQAVTDKEKRALPIAALTQKGMVRMIGDHKKLEEQLCTWIPRTGKSPDRLDAMVWGMHEFFVKPELPRGTLDLGWY
jgi:phage terminase large subunit-like protein